MLHPTRLAGTLAICFTLIFCVSSSFAADGLVSNLNDSGPGSLRAAIDAANADHGGSIRFAPALIGQTIAIASTLNLSGGGVTVNGDINADGKPDIVLDGGDSVWCGLYIPSANNTVSGLVLNRFRAYFVEIEGQSATGNGVRGCYNRNGHHWSAKRAKPRRR